MSKKHRGVARLQHPNIYTIALNHDLTITLNRLRNEF